MNAFEQPTFIGMGGWELEASNSCFYPPKPKKGFRKLEYYSQFFNSVEVNATHYNNNLSPLHARQWVEDVSANKEFKFTVKLFQGFTHNLTATMEDVEATCKLLDALASADKLGGLLIQFPYLFTNMKERRQYLMQLSKLFGAYRMFVELRHNSWFNPMVFNFLQENKLHWVNSDRPRQNNTTPFTCVAWGGVSYFRMMGRGLPPAQHKNTTPASGERAIVESDYFYNAEDLRHLQYIVNRVRPQAATSFVFFHNDPATNALINGFQFQHLMKDKQRVLAPQNLIASYPALNQISIPVNTLHPLFAELETNQPHNNMAA